MSYSNRNSIAVTWVAIALLFVAVACWLAWDWSSYLTEKNIRAEKTAEYHDQYAEDAIDEKCLSLEPMPMRDCIHEQIEAARDHERAEQDLDAQQAMAKFTRVMGHTAIIGLFLGGGSIALIFMTLFETQRMAKTASETNSIMRSEQRPWVRILWQVSCEVEVEDERFARVCWHYNFENKGRTPAHNVRISWGVHRYDTKFVGAGGRPVPIETQKAIYRKSISQKVLFQGEETQFIPHSHWTGSHTIEGDSDGDLFLCACVAYDLDPLGKSTGYETVVLAIRRDADMFGPFAHRALNIRNYQEVR